MTTAKQLAEMLLKYGDMPVLNEKNEPFIHIVNRLTHDNVTLSTTKPIGYCNKCGEYAYPEKEIPEYTGYCPSCDENLYEFEIHI